MGSAPEDNTKASGEQALKLLSEPKTDILAQLQVLNINNAGLTTFPDEALAFCKQLVRLDIGGNPLSSLPVTLVSLPSLDILFASKIGLTDLPDLTNCSKLRMLGVKDNSLTHLDGSKLPESLEWLIAAGNQIEVLPNISRLQRVRKLMLSHNRLTCEALAPIAGIAALEMIRVAANRLEAFPEALLGHPRLAWVAVGGNPFTDKALDRCLDNGPHCLDYNEVSLKDRLGSGAGATVVKGSWRERDVAVKIWDSECFSDGTAVNEWAINRVASSPGSPDIVGILGAFQEPKRGLVLELLEGATAAAGPPSFSTVTRDTLPCHGGPGPRYEVHAAIAIALAVASASAYLHGKGIAHGDIYLHNTLVILDGTTDAASVKDVRLSDFGAAAAIEDIRLRRLDVRSYGWLLQDLLESIVTPTTDQELAMVSLLKEIREQCGRTIPEELPDFASIAGKIEENFGSAAKKARKAQ